MHTLNEIIEKDKKYYMNTFGDRAPVMFERGDGMFLYDSDGKCYADLFGGIAVNALGHAHPDFTNALKNQIDKIIHTSSLYYIESQALLAEKLCEISCGDKVFFANSGAEANEGAIKLARAYFKKKGHPEKYEFITLINSFHGRTITTATATGQSKYSELYKPLTPGFKHVTINNIDEMKAAVTENTCAIMLEAIQGESGVHPLDYDYVQEVAALCKEKELLLIFDEVQTGIGRTGKWFGYMHYDIEPDIFTLAKALGGGVPIGTTVAKWPAAFAFSPGDHGTTFGGNPLACRAGLTVLDIIEREGLIENAVAKGKLICESLQKNGTIPAEIFDKRNADFIAKDISIPEFSGTTIKEIRGKGLMIGIELAEPKAVKCKNALFENGIIVGSIGDSVIRIVPPLNI